MLARSGVRVTGTTRCKARIGGFPRVSQPAAAARSLRRRCAHFSYWNGITTRNAFSVSSSYSLASILTTGRRRQYGDGGNIFIICCDMCPLWADYCMFVSFVL